MVLAFVLAFGQNGGMEGNMETKKKSVRRSHCHFCSRAITEKAVVKAADAQQYIAEYCAAEDELVWIDTKENKSMCDENGIEVAHITTKEWEAGQ